MSGTEQFKFIFYSFKFKVREIYLINFEILIFIAIYGLYYASCDW